MVVLETGSQAEDLVLKKGYLRFSREVLLFRD